MNQLSQSSFLRPTQKIALHFCHIDHIYLPFSLLNSSDIKMVPQYCSDGSAGVPAVHATIFMSALDGGGSPKNGPPSLPITPFFNAQSFYTPKMVMLAKN